MSASAAASDLRGRVSVGIGSWTDAEYVGVVFPKGVKPEERLAMLATRFGHVEVNSSYHALPRRAWVENWAKQTPAGFIFDFKLPRVMAENPAAVAESDEMAARLLDTVQPLIEARKLGAFFVVLPPGFSPKKHRLEELDALRAKLQPHLLAVELRHNGWVEGAQRARTLEYFRKQGLAWIAVDMPRIEGSTIMPPVDEVTNPALAYLRLHGRRGDWPRLRTAEERHSYAYSAAELEEIAARVRGLAAQAEHVRVVANNHAEDFAPKTALALQELLGLGRATDGKLNAETGKRGGDATDSWLPGF